MRWVSSQSSQTVSKINWNIFCKQINNMRHQWTYQLVNQQPNIPICFDDIPRDCWQVQPLTLSQHRYYYTSSYYYSSVNRSPLCHSEVSGLVLLSFQTDCIFSWELVSKEMYVFASLMILNFDHFYFRGDWRNIQLLQQTGLPRGEQRVSAERDHENRNLHLQRWVQESGRQQYQMFEYW